MADYNGDMKQLYNDQAVSDSAMTIQTGIKSNGKNYENFCYWLNGVDVTDQNLDQFTPYIQGVSRLFLYKAPPFLMDILPTKTKNFKSLIETGYTRIDGIQDTNVETVDFEGGFGGQKFRNVSLASNDTDTITVSLYEQSGSPIREYIDAWVTGMRDIRSGIAHYHGGLATNEYSERNHTAEFIYCTLDPTGRHIEYACMFAHAFPLKVPKAHLNYETRNRGNVLMDLEFAVQMYESPAINAIANYLVANSKVEYNYLRFTPNLSPGSIVNTYSTNNSIGVDKNGNYIDSPFINNAKASNNYGSSLDQLNSIVATGGNNVGIESNPKKEG